MTPGFISNTGAEFLKTKGTFAFWLTVGGAAFIPVLNFIRLVARPDIFVQRMTEDPWNAHLDGSWGGAASFLLPVFVIMVASVVVNIETANNTWKQVFASPRSYADIFFSKFIVILVMLFFGSILFSLFILLSAYATALFVPAYPFLSKPVPWERMYELNTRLYVAILGVAAIQYGLSLRFKNPIVPIGIGIAALISGLFARQWEYISYYPYTHPYLYYHVGPQNPQVAMDVLIISPITCLLVLLLVFTDFSYRRERG